MPAMPSHKNLFHLPHPDAPLAGYGYPIHHLEQDGAASSLQASSADRIMIPCTKDISSMHQRDSTCLSDAFECDDFRMYDYKVRRCMRGRSHDWTDCPFAHPGEKARRRDPRKFHYSGEPCPDFRKGSCWTGDACEYAHGVFECWLHPARYRTQPCKDGRDCTRRVCFFAHSMQQLRHVAGLVEEPCMEGASVKVKSQAHELYPQRHALRIPEGMCLLEDSFKWMVSMGGSYEHELGLSPQTTSSTLSSMDAYYANAGYVSEIPAMLPLPSRNISPFEAISTVGFSSSNAMGVPLQVPPSSAMFSIVTPWPFVGLSGTGVILQNVSSMYEQSSEPAIFAPASSLLSYTSRTTSEHSTHLGGQQAAAWQSLCKREGNGKEGQSTFNTSTYVSDMVHYGGCGDTAMPHSFMHISERRRTDTNEVINELNGGSKIRSLTDKLCKFSSFNACDIRCLSSPTSTLAGPSNPSPFLSPPLSPLSTPSSETSNVFSLRDYGNVQADDISPMAYAYIQNGPRWKDLGIKHVSTDQCTLHSHHHSQRLEYGALPGLELPSFSQHMSAQNKWIHPHKNWSLEDTYECDISQLTSDNMQKESRDRYGDEGRVENTLPDLGWVHELVN